VRTPGPVVNVWSLARDLELLERDRLALLAQMCILQGKNQAAIDWSETALRSGLLEGHSHASTLVGALQLEGRSDEAFALLPSDGDVSDAGCRELVGMRGILQYMAGDLTGAAENLRIRLRPNRMDHTRGTARIELLAATRPDGIEPNKMIILAVLAKRNTVVDSGMWQPPSPTRWLLSSTTPSSTGSRRGPTPWPHWYRPAAEIEPSPNPTSRSHERRRSNPGVS
jgi:hypothetical protein